MEELVKLGVPVWHLVLRSAVIYLALLIALRLFGKREVGQFTIYDLVLILLVANAVQPAMTGPDTSLLGGLIIIATLILLNLVVGRLARLTAFKRLFTPAPTILIKDGAYLESSLAREQVSKEDTDMAIREHGFDSVEEVKLAVLEPDGSISIVPKDAQMIRSRRRVRYRRF